MTFFCIYIPLNHKHIIQSHLTYIQVSRNTATSQCKLLDVHSSHSQRLNTDNRYFVPEIFNSLKLASSHYIKGQRT